MYKQSAAIYDALYRSLGKGYAAEAEKLRELIREYKRSEGNSLLDVGCGTGNHIAHLRTGFGTDGLDQRVLLEANYHDVH